MSDPGDRLQAVMSPTQGYSVFNRATQPWPHTPREGDPRFLALLDEIEQLHARKQRDYGTGADPFANVRASEELGIPGWIGALVRLNDKMRRLNKAARQVIAGEAVNMEFDGPIDDLMDGAVYMLIAAVLYKEQAKVEDVVPF